MGKKKGGKGYCIQHNLETSHKFHCISTKYCIDDYTRKKICKTIRKYHKDFVYSKFNNLDAFGMKSQTQQYGNNFGDEYCQRKQPSA